MVFIPIAVFCVTGLAAGIVSALVELRARPRPEQKRRLVLVHDKGPAPLLRSRPRWSVPQAPIRLVINGG